MKSIKNQILALAFVTIISCVNAFANDGRAAIFRGTIYASGTHFATPMSDAKWDNANTQTSTNANYTNFDGETFIALISYDKQSEIVLESKVKVAKGQLCMIVENSNGDVLFEKSFHHDETIEAKLTLDVYEQYKIRFIGEETKGSYHCKWTQQ